MNPTKIELFIRRLTIAALICASNLGSSALGNEIKFFGTEPDPTEMANFLFAAPNLGKSRSLKIKQYEAPVNAAVVPILFEFDSTELKAETLITIQSIAQMLNTKRAEDESIVIEGHTDAVGDAAYNKDLSMRRAFAVKNMLVQAFNISPERLVIDGKGESELHDKNTPNSAVNRRVQLKRFDKNN